jgi:hypothetical protein
MLTISPLTSRYVPSGCIFATLGKYPDRMHLRIDSLAFAASLHDPIDILYRPKYRFNCARMETARDKALKFNKC